MAPANKQTPVKSGPQRSIKSFFTKSPGKALPEASDGKKKGGLEVGHTETPKESVVKEKKKLDMDSGITCTPGKRKAAAEVGQCEAVLEGAKTIGGEGEANDELHEVEATPAKRRRLKKVQDRRDSDSLVISSARERMGSAPRGAVEDSAKSVIGRRLRVYWPLDKAWYAGRVKDYNENEETHVIVYDDGEEEEVDIVKEKVEWLSESETVENGGGRKRPKRRLNEGANSDSESNRGYSSTGDESAGGTAAMEEEKEGRPRRGRSRRQLRSIVESDEGSGDDDDDDDADFHVESSEGKESEQEEVEDDDEDDELNEPEEESDSDSKARKKPKKNPPSSSSKKTTGRGVKKLSQPVLSVGKGSAALKGSSLAKGLSGATTLNSGRLETSLSFSNGIVSSDPSPLAGEAAERFGGRDSEKFKFLGKDRKDASGRKPTDPAYNPCTLHLPADFIKGLSGGQRQWWMFKAKHMDKVLLFKMGKFYEMFEMDAHIGAKELDLQYMKGEQPHCGFPEKNFSDNAHKLALKGYRVLVVEQTETPDQLEKRRKETGSKDKVVMREVCAVITKGTMVDADLTRLGGEGMAMLSIVEHVSETGSPLIGLCVVDSSTGCFQLGQFEDDPARMRLSSVLTELRPVELILPRSTLSSATSRVLRDCTRKPLVNEMNPSDLWDSEKTLKEVISIYSGLRSDSTKNAKENLTDEELLPNVLRYVKGLGEKGKMALSAFGVCVTYLRQALLDKALLAVGRFELLPVFDALLQDPESKVLVEQGKAGVDAAFRRIEPHMVLDGAALENLEVLENGDGGTNGTLLAKLDHCVTPFGRRLLRAWLARPLLLEESIRQRQMAVKDLKGVALDAVARFRKELGGLLDLERALARLYASSGSNGRNAAKVVMYEDVGKKQVLQFTSVLRGCRSMLQAVQNFDSCLSELSSTRLRDLLTFGKGMPDMKSTIEHFEVAFDWSEAELSGRILPREGVDSDFDAASSVISEVESKLDAYLEEQREHFGNSSEVVYLTVGKESYQMEVPERFLAKVPRDFEVRSSRKGYRRYWSPAIKSFLQELAAGQEQRESALKDILMRLVRDFCKYNSTWLSAVQTIAELDVLISISAASVYTEGPTCTPTFSEGGQQAAWFHAKGLRHPTVGQEFSFVPNDINLGGEHHPPFMLLTGPNMGGKSTLLRQVCLAVILAQVGADVPAEELQLAPVDQVFVRMGARDNIMAGQSTFLVELQETATMLRSATKNSLVALDELGRGTATSDGQAIAHAVLWGLTNTIGCRGIFSTHYHRLATEHATDPTVALHHMGCKVASTKGGLEEVTFLYKLCPGACPKSYGVNVARLAGMPESILQRASARSSELESSFEQRRNYQPLHGSIVCKLYKALGHYLENVARDPSNLESLETLMPLWAEARELVLNLS